MNHSISVDVEEYYHAANLAPAAPRSQWSTLPSRVVKSTMDTLEIFAKTSTKGTFFILGSVAEKHPGLIRDISAEGHELASHGQAHKLAYQQSPDEFFQDITQAKKFIEDCSGREVLGYRAPNFSITDANLWAYDKLIEAGYAYDSSVYPTWHPRYSNLNKPRGNHRIERDSGALFEFPLAVGQLNLFGRTLPLPVAGGAYWRLLPMSYNQFGLRRIESADKLSFNCYFHPWELDSEQPKFNSLPFKTRLRHYGNCAKFGKRVEKMLNRFNFMPIIETAKESFGSEALKMLQSQNNS